MHLPLRDFFIHVVTKNCNFNLDNCAIINCFLPAMHSTIDGLTEIQM